MSACHPSVSVQGERDGRVVLDSIITCPHCGRTKTEPMPVDACQIVYQCTGCGVQLRPKAGDCCVFCSYGSVRCPPVQVNYRAVPVNGELSRFNGYEQRSNSMSVAKCLFAGL